MMPGKSVSPRRSLSMRFCRTSSLTLRRLTRPRAMDVFKSPSVAGRELTDIPLLYCRVRGASDVRGPQMSDDVLCPLRPLCPLCPLCLLLMEYSSADEARRRSRSRRRYPPSAVDCRSGARRPALPDSLRPRLLFELGHVDHHDLGAVRGESRTLWDGG